MILILLITAALFTVAKTWKQPTNMSINRWMDKEHVSYVYTMEYYLAIKRNKIMLFEATWGDLMVIILSEVSQTEKDEYMISLICEI